MSTMPTVLINKYILFYLKHYYGFYMIFLRFLVKKSGGEWSWCVLKETIWWGRSVWLFPSREQAQMTYWFMVVVIWHRMKRRRHFFKNISSLIFPNNDTKTCGVLFFLFFRYVFCTYMGLYLYVSYIECDCAAWYLY